MARLKTIAIILIALLALFAGCTADNDNNGIIDNDTGLNYEDDNGLLILHVRGTGIENTEFDTIILTVDDINIDEREPTNIDWGFDEWFAFIGEDNRLLFEVGSNQSAFLAAEEIDEGNYVLESIDVDNVVGIRAGEEVDMEVLDDEILINRDFTITRNQSTELVITIDLGSAVIAEDDIYQIDFGGNFSIIES